jgi:signal transduction histidine kinase
MDQEDFKRVLNALPVGVFVLDRDGRPFYANDAACALLGRGLRPDTSVGGMAEVYRAYRAGTDVLYPAGQLPIVRALEGESCSVSDMEIHREDRVVPLEVTAAPVRGSDGRVAWAIAVFRDISDRIRQEDILRRDQEELELRVAERTDALLDAYESLRGEVEQRSRAQEALQIAKEAAERADRAKTVFLANMSHDLRTPLNHILGYTGLLEEALLDRGLDELLPDLARIREAGSHLVAIISDILDLAKIETGEVELVVSDFAVAPFLDELVEAVRPFGDRNRNELVRAWDGSLGLMRGDRAKVRQALWNPLVNACRYTVKGQVTLAASREPGGGAVVFRVADTGTGMTAEQVVNLFGGLGSADTSAMRRSGGTGLGLALARRFCEVMGGTLDVESAPGRGTTVTLRIPTVV